MLDNQQIRPSRNGDNVLNGGSQQRQVGDQFLKGNQLDDGMSQVSHTSANNANHLKSESKYKQINAKDESGGPHQNFTKLCPVEFYQNQTSCWICQQKLNGFFQNKVNCQFCGRVVCKECSKRKRPNPTNKDEFAIICDGCHVQYLYKIIFDEYLSRKKKREDQYQNQVQINLQLKQQIQTYVQQKEQIVSNLREQQLKFEQDKSKFEEELTKKKLQIQKIEDQNKKLNEKYADVNSMIKSVSLQIEQAKEEQKNLEKQLEQTNKELEAKEKQCNDLDYQITQAEIKIKDKQLRIINLKQPPSNSASNSKKTKSNTVIEQMVSRQQTQNYKTSLIDSFQSSYLSAQVCDENNEEKKKTKEIKQNTRIKDPSLLSCSDKCLVFLVTMLGIIVNLNQSLL